jgi:molybdate transport system substrate-binding protein
LPTIKVMSAGAVKEMVAGLGAEFEKATGIEIDYHFGTAGAMRDRVEQGEAADLIVIAQSGIATLDKMKLVVAGSARDLGRTVSGVIVRKGAAAPDISTPAAFVQALTNAKSVAYVDPKAGGTGGIMFAAMLDKLGIADAINKKAVLGKNGHSVAQSVADGRAEIGATFISEVLPIAGAQVVGPLPGELHIANGYAAAIHIGSANPEAAKAFLAALTDPAGRPRWVEAGLEPAF